MGCRQARSLKRSSRYSQEEVWLSRGNREIPLSKKRKKVSTKKTRKKKSEKGGGAQLQQEREVAKDLSAK